MKKLYLFAALAAMLAACSENDLTKDTAVQQNAEEGAVQFSAYMSRGTTRAGVPGTLTTAGTGADLKKVSLQEEGFGVLAYYNDGEPYSENSKPDFMYNQKVTYGGTSWQYNPVKYWPNEFGSDAISEGTDRLTFFAYAPYVEVDLSTGLAKVREGKGEEATTGIIALTRNTTHGDPFVKYYADFNPEKRVDLCWGVAKSEFNSSVTGTANNIAAGKPYIDVVKPKVSDKINFDFKHALAALNVTIDADIDEAGHGTNDYADGTTKIWVRSITFEGFTDKGMLNLNGSALDAKYTPEWYDLSGNNKIGSGGKTTIHDGLRDGSEPLGLASNEIPAALNPQIIQSEVYSASPYTALQTENLLTGVPSTQSVNLFNSSTKSEPIYVIPTNDDMKVTIVYDVETADKNLTNYLADGVVRGSCVENKITKDIKIENKNFKLQAGKLYTIALHLGMTSVKFEASVTEWGDANATDDTWLPVNAPSATISPTDPKAINIPADTYKGSLQVTGLTPGETANIAISGANITSPANGSTVKVDANGTANVNFVVSANDKIAPINGSTITVSEGSNTATLTINQAAHALALTPASITNNTIVITSGAGGIGDWSAVATITADRNRVGETTPTHFVKAVSAAEGVSFSFSNGTLTFHANDKLKAGDVYTITFDPGTGKAPKETVTVKVGGIAFAQDLYPLEYGQKFKPTPIIYGVTPTVYTYSKDAGTSASVVVAGTEDVKGWVKAVAAGSNTKITVSTNQTDGNGYFVCDGSKEAEYSVSVTATTGATISYVLPNVTAATKAIGVIQGITTGAAEDVVLTKALLKNRFGDELTQGDDTNEDGGKVTYTIVSVKKGGTDITASNIFSINATGKLETNVALDAGTIYTIEVRADVNATGNGNVTYSDQSTNATFTLTTAAP